MAFLGSKTFLVTSLF